MKITVRNISENKRVFGFDRKQVFEMGVGISARVEANKESVRNIDRFVADKLIEVIPDEPAAAPVVEAPESPAQERESHDPISKLKSPDKKPPQVTEESEVPPPPADDLPVDPTADATGESAEPSVDSAPPVVDTEG